MRERIIFDTPAKDWNEALPVGNGRMGAMIYGGVSTELLQLNEDSIWYGGPKDRVNPSAKENLPLIRKALDEGRIKDAQELCAFALSGIPETQSHYETLGNLYILFEGDDKNVSSYERYLDLGESEAVTRFTKDDVTYERRIIASYPDKVIAVKLNASEKGKLSFHTQLSRGNITWDLGPYQNQIYRHPNYNNCVDEIINDQPDTTILTATMGGNGSMRFACKIKVVVKGGRLISIGNSLKAECCDEAMILVSAVSEFYEKDIEGYITKILDKASAKGEDSLWKDHKNDYKALYQRTDLDIPDDDVVRLFNFGKYLLISGSREGSQPLNLQGIWNKDFDPMWGSKYTININAQMNYWPCERLDLSECHLPLFDLIERMRPRGEEVARKMYGMNGFVAHHNTDLWGDCAPQDVCLSSSYWVMGAAWLCLHIWDHYDHTCDKEFLKEHFDTMLSAARFLLDYSVEENGNLVIYTTLSPENIYKLPNGEVGAICKGCAMDDQIMREFFECTLKAGEVLESQDAILDEIRSAIPKINEVKIYRFGGIMEWEEDYEETEVGHRHISHLFGLYPGNSINTDELKDAAGKTLERRLSFGGGHTGWSRAWIINMYAALGDGEKAYEHIRLLMSNSLLPNLFDNHPPFQIDGNFGLLAGICNMIIGKNEELLSAIPSKWDKGSVKGFKLSGNKKIDMSWENGKITNKRIY